MKALLERFEPRLERFATTVRRGMFAWMMYLMICWYVFIYALIVGVALAAWYGVACIFGLAVPAHGLFSAVWSYYQSPIPNTVINIGAMFIIAWWVFMLRTLYRRVYAIVEMIIGAVIASSVNLNDADQKKVLLTVAGGIYVMVRGLDNLDKTLSAESGGAALLHYFAPFLRHTWLSDNTTTLTEYADHRHWRSVAETDSMGHAAEEPGLSAKDSS